MPTPNPSFAQIYQNRPLVNGDSAFAVAEVVTRLRQLLPGYIEYRNEQENRTTSVDKIPVPDGHDILVAPVDLTQVKKNCVLVACRADTSPQGIGAFKNVFTVPIWSVEPRAQTEGQILSHLRRIECVREVLLPFLTGCVAENGQTAWRLLEPRGFEIIGDRKEFGGARATYILVQSPNLGLGS